MTTENEMVPLASVAPAARIGGVHIDAILTCTRSARTLEVEFVVSDTPPYAGAQWELNHCALTGGRLHGHQASGEAVEFFDGSGLHLGPDGGSKVWVVDVIESRVPDPGTWRAKITLRLPARA